MQKSIMSSATSVSSASAQSGEGISRSVLIFSPDADVARTIALNLEEKYAFVRETTLHGLSQALENKTPDLLVLDLFTFSEDVVRLLDVVREKGQGVPVVTLRGYIPLRKDVTMAVEEMSFVVFFKPVDSETVSEAIENRLNALGTPVNPGSAVKKEQSDS